MAKKKNLSYNEIPDMSEDWALDPRNGFKYSGESVQKFIKEQLKNRMGVFYYDSGTNKILAFADEASRDLYLADSEVNRGLLLGSFDAEAQYQAEITLLSSPVVNVLKGATGNYIDFTFDIKNKSGASVGDSVTCTYTFNNGGSKTEVRESYTPGTQVHFLCDEYLKEGTNNVTIGIMGRTTLAGTQVGATYTMIDLTLTSTFDFAQVRQTTDTLEVPYVVAGTGVKYVEWYVDGVKYGEDDTITDATGIRTKYIEYSLANGGKHTLQLRAYVVMDGVKFYSETLYYDYAVVQANYITPLVATILPVGTVVTDALTLNVTQYQTLSLEWAIYDSRQRVVNVDFVVDGVTVNSFEANNGETYVFSYAPTTKGTKSLQIVCEGTSYEIGMEVADSGMNITEATEGLTLKLSALGRSNSDAGKAEWTYGDYATTFNNFAFTDKQGWNGKALVISGGSSIEVDIKALATNWASTGGTIELDFETSDVVDAEAVICECMDDNTGAGFRIKPNETTMQSSGGAVIDTKYKDNERHRIAVIVNKATGVADAGLMFIVSDGKLSRSVSFATTDSFVCNETLKIGDTTGNATIKLYSVQIYNRALTEDEAYNNWALNSDNINAIVQRNDIFLADGKTISPEKVAARCPVMIAIGDMPKLIAARDKDTNVHLDLQFMNYQDPTKNFTAKSVKAYRQGTSSLGYDIPNLNIEFDETTVLLDADGNDITADGYVFITGAYPQSLFCLKADYAESSMSHNTGIARMWNEAMKNVKIGDEYVCRTEAQKAAIAASHPYDVRTTIDGFPMVMFYKTSENSELVCMGQYNFNNDKKNENVFGFKGVPDFDNSKVECWECLNNTHPLALFESAETFDDAWEDAFEARYPRKNKDTTLLKPFVEWVASTKGDVEKFSAEKYDHLDVWKTAAYYVYLMREGAIDQTVKNSMVTTEDGEHWFYINYDNDSVHGLRNDSALLFLPTMDRQSLDPQLKDTYCYAGHDSVLWNNCEADADFMDKVKQIDNALYSAGYSYQDCLKYFDELQCDKWNEKLYNINGRYKYIQPFQTDGTNYLHMLQGDRKSHRHWWLKTRFELYDAKWVSGAYKSKVIEFKAPDANGDFSIVAGRELEYGYGINNDPIEVNVALGVGESHTFTTPRTLAIGDPVRIYGANNVRRLDLSNFKKNLASLNVLSAWDSENGSRFKELILGNDNSDVNEALSDISGLPSVESIEVLDIRGFKAMKSLNLSKLGNLTTVRASNAGLTSFAPASGGNLKEATLPDTLQVLQLDQLAYLPISGLTLEGNGAAIREYRITNCAQLCKDISLPLAWMANKSGADGETALEMTGIEWMDVAPEDFLKFCTAKQNGMNIVLKGRVRLTTSSEEIINTITEAFGAFVFSPDNELYISAPDAIYLAGADSVLEGDSAQYTAAVFSEYTGKVEWSLVGGNTDYESIDQYGLLTTKYKASARVITIQAKHYPTQGAVTTVTKSVNIVKQIRPTSGTISGFETASDNGVYELSVSPSGINTDYSVGWSLSGAGYDEGFVSIKSSNKSQCVLSVVTGGKGEVTLTATITDVAGNTVTASKTLLLGMKLIMAVTSNQGNDADIASVGVSVTAGEETYTVTNGTYLSLPQSTTVHIVFPAVDGYTTPAEQEFVTGDADITVTATYLTTKVTVTIADNQSSYNDIADLVVKVSASGMTAKSVKSGVAVKVPQGETCVVTFPFLTDYKKPDDLTFVAEGTSMSKSGTYQTEVVTVDSVTKMDDTGTSSSVTGVTITINGTSYAWDGTTIRHKVPFDTTYTVTASDLSGYNAPTKSYTASVASRSVQLTYSALIGTWIKLNQTITDPATMLSGDINGEHIQLIRKNSHRYLGKYTAEGTMTICQLDDENSTLYKDGTTADLTGAEGDVFMRLPRFWYKAMEQATDIWMVGFYYGTESPGDDWKEWDGTDLIGVYEAYSTSSKVYSRSGVTSSGSISQASFKTYARKRGTGFSLVKWKHQNIMAFLYYAMYGHMNCQEKIGYGTNADSKTTGQTNGLGMEDTVAGVNGDSQSINFWGLENWWGNKYEWVDNVVVNPDSTWRITEDDGTTRDVKGYYGTNGPMTKAVIGEYLDLIPSSTHTSSYTQGYCDYVYNGSESIARVVRRSNIYSSANGGVACAVAFGDSSTTYSGSGSRLAFRGVLVEAESVEAYQSLEAIG